MDNVLAIAFGLGLRFIVDAIGHQDFKLTGTLVGLWEGAVTLHFVKKMPESFDPYLAYAVRLFLDFLITESILRMVLIIVWTALGMVLADIAPELWSGLGGHRIWRRFRRDMRHISRRLPEIPSFPRARVVRFSPVIEPVEITETASVLSPSAVSPAIQPSTAKSPSTTTAPVVRKRPVPGQFLSSTISETDTDLGSVYGVRAGPTPTGVGTSHHRYSVRPRRPSIGAATEESSVTNESDDVNPSSDASSTSTETVNRVVEVPETVEEPMRSEGKGKERAVDPIDIPPIQRHFELPPTPSDSNRPHPHRLSSVPPPLSGMPSIPDFLESGLGSDWEHIKKEDLPSPPPEKASPTPVRYVPPPAPSTIGDPTPRPSTFDQDLWDNVSNVPTQPFHTGMTPAPRPSRLPVTKSRTSPNPVFAATTSKPVPKKKTVDETKPNFTPMFGANDEWAPETQLPPDTPSVFNQTPAFDLNRMDIGPEDNANVQREVGTDDARNLGADPSEGIDQDAAHGADVPPVPQSGSPAPVSGVDPHEQLSSDPLFQQNQQPPEQSQPVESGRVPEKKEREEKKKEDKQEKKERQDRQKKKERQERQEKPEEQEEQQWQQHHSDPLKQSDLASQSQPNQQPDQSDLISQSQLNQQSNRLHSTSRSQLNQRLNQPPVEPQQQQPLAQPQEQGQVPRQEPELEELEPSAVEPSAALKRKKKSRRSARSTPEGSQTPRVPHTPATTILGDFVSRTFDDASNNKPGTGTENQPQPLLGPSGAGSGNGVDMGRDEDLLGLNENNGGSNEDTQGETGKSGNSTPPNGSGENGEEIGEGAGVGEPRNDEDANVVLADNNEQEVVQPEVGEGNPSSASSTYSSVAGVPQEIKERNKQAIIIRAQIFELEKTLENMKREKVKAEGREELDPLSEESQVIAKEIEKAEKTLQKLIKRAEKRHQAAVESTQFLTTPKTLNLEKYTAEKAALRTEDVLGLFFNADCTKFTLGLSFPKGGASKAYTTSVNKVLTEYGIKSLPKINGMSITLTTKTYQDSVTAFRQKHSKDSGDS